jgi:integrase
VKATDGFATKLKAVNARLSRCKLVQHSERLYVRSSHFPPKPGSRSNRPEYATGYRATSLELKLAEGMAIEIDGQLLRDRFDWADWLQDKALPPEHCLDWVERLEADYWGRHQKTLNTLNTWRKSYQQYYNELPVESPLSEELMIGILRTRYKSGSRSRQLCSVAFGMLAQFAGIERTKIAALGQGYRPEPKSLKTLPTDEQIEYAIDNCDRREWQWAAGVQAVFGLRPHEIFRLNLDQISEGIISVSENSKTGARDAYACPFEWIERWKLNEICYPKMELDRANNDIGSRCSYFYRALGLHQPKKYRDAWVIRVRLRGVDPGISSRAAGHSQSVEDRSYLSALQERHFKQAFEKIRDSKA